MGTEVSSDDELVPVTRGMLRRWAETLDGTVQDEDYGEYRAEVVSEAMRSVLAQSNAAQESGR